MNETTETPGVIDDDIRVQLQYKQDGFLQLNWELMRRELESWGILGPVNHYGYHSVRLEWIFKD